ncbi:MAG: N-acyl homoserine lactonase family protein [Firmicutes bacterium]|nr:N-acyl homoserine lactonase family protein [Bacillota bacterium]
MIYEIKPILIGEFGPVHNGIKYRNGDVSHQEMVPSFLFYIRTNDNHVLIDTGFSRVDGHKEIINVKFNQKKQIEEILKDNNINYEKINFIICTHLHWDHIGNINLFPNAKIILQLEELTWALTAPIWEPGYIKFFLKQILKKIDEEKVLIVNGNKFINKDIKVIKVRGHTPGSQMVVTYFNGKEVVISGDIIMTYKNIEEEIPIGLFYNLKECQKVITLIKERKCIVLPSHDWKVLEYKSLLEFY